MAKEFNLSDWLEQSSWAYMCIPEEKVKEFIKRLKEDDEDIIRFRNGIAKCKCNNGNCINCQLAKAFLQGINHQQNKENKLAGDELI